MAMPQYFTSDSFHSESPLLNPQCFDQSDVFAQSKAEEDERFFSIFPEARPHTSQTLTNDPLNDLGFSYASLTPDLNSPLQFAALSPVSSPLHAHASSFSPRSPYNYLNTLEEMPSSSGIIENSLPISVPIPEDAVLQEPLVVNTLLGPFDQYGEYHTTSPEAYGSPSYTLAPTLHSPIIDQPYHHLSPIIPSPSTMSPSPPRRYAPHPYKSDAISRAQRFPRGATKTTTSLTSVESVRRPIPKAEKPSLACFFCRQRKIACGPADLSGDDRTCNQCSKRSLRCEYPSESRRGMRKKKAAGELSQ